MLHIEKAEYCSDYKIKVFFNDGLVGIADFEKTINNDSLFLVQQLKDINLFKEFNVKLHTIVWTNGLDFAPEFIKSCIEKK
ncbi:MAG: DUF2442 domain-containing protein [Spirochaetaceae bacterium]|nr:DUF2442 domain-containing protein [Spirochaetaceae bacterium]